jgi:phenylalanyl-tRNA synthetase alpha chain
MESVSLRDLSDPATGVHAMQILLRDLHSALLTTSPTAILEYRGPRIVSVADNYDALGFAAATVTRDRRYTRYVTEDTVLRTHTSAMIPRLLRDLARTLLPDDDVVLLAPGIVYRRDCIDRLHTGEPHQLDVWRIARRRALSLDALVATIVSAVLPGRTHVMTPAVHPYTKNGQQIDVEGVEIGECGRAHPEVLRAAGLPRGAHGLALGLGLDRLVMLRKGVPDVRLLRSTDPRVAAQMLDLSPYRPVTTQPSTARDLSLAVSVNADAESLGDRVRVALGQRAIAVEEVRVLSETPGAALPAQARARLGLQDGQKNVLVRIVLSDLDRTLTHAEANLLRDVVYAALHEGTVHVWACGAPPAELR